MKPSKDPSPMLFNTAMNWSACITYYLTIGDRPYIEFILKLCDVEQTNTFLCEFTNSPVYNNNYYINVKIFLF